jgi:hypothetical protein
LCGRRPFCERNIRTTHFDGGQTVTAIDGGLLFAVIYEVPLLTLVPRTAHVTLTLRHIKVGVRKFRLARQEVRLDGIKRLFEGFLMRDLASHQESWARASAAMFDRRSAVGSVRESTYAAAQGTPAELVRATPPP